MSTTLPAIGQVDSRFTRALLCGAGLAFAMFWSLQTLIATRGYDPGIDTILMPVAWDPLIKVQPIDPKRRQPPPPREPPKPPQVKKLIVDAPAPDARPELIAMPKMDTTTTGLGPVMGPTGVGSTDGELVPVLRVKPQYPRAAACDGISGWVVFELVINPDGTVRSAKAVKAQPRGMFEAAATQAIMRWKFRPKVEDGKAVESRGTQQIDFKLEDE